MNRLSRKVDTAKTKINVAEFKRSARLVLDEIEQGMQKLFTGIYWDFQKAGGDAAAKKVMKLTRELSALVTRKRNSLSGRKRK
jgi:hypothetical protein